MRKIVATAFAGALLANLSACGGGSDNAGPTPAPVPTPAPTPAPTPVPTPTPVPQTWYTTKTPYSPKQDTASYEVPPAGFSPVYTELVARHGSRGLSSLKYDAAMYAIWQKAAADGALTELGQKLGPDLMRLMKANALLGYGVAGISTPGYGNLTAVGIAEHQQLAARLLKRLPAYFDDVARAAGSGAARQIVVQSSGVDRAVDSASFFSQSLTGNAPALKPVTVAADALTAYPANAPVAQAAGVNRFLLYFHKLVAKTDLVSDPASPYYQTYQDSLAFQAYAADADLSAKLAGFNADPALKTAARTVLERLFTKTFVDRIDNGTYSFANSGSFSFTSDDGKFTNTLTGDGKTTVKGIVDVVSMLYNVYVITPAFKGTLDLDFGAYLPDAQARTFAYLQDAQDFYAMGPGMTEAGTATFRMATALREDFFNEVDAIAKGQLGRAAKLRFTHAEIIIPFASSLGLANVYVPVPKAQTYSYDNNPWRGELVSPMAANVQWDVYRDAGGRLLVKMLYNERETAFKADCEGARFKAGSNFYDYGKLKACYGHVAS
ncbi:histidine-type phosphatase [Jeongeupia naejangsanensis]|uniref:Multiple inositol polyphosphate phosphatase 1 n=1 Tax=Jeongeupia naejangsanensis TaxID=613195 RepID=A0ABS2BII0_9NEIS|nr:histidine-type phosphatase [Jeongeupia naejangsanensis]MBM3115411.1 hypothetical protein [Jeongeupia naejangsanensis]